MLKTFLNQTMTCEDCKGTGKDSEKEATCGMCKGSGAVIDSVIPNIIKKFAPGIDRSKLPEIMDAIFNHIQKKIDDSYERGKLDGKSEADENKKVN